METEKCFTIATSNTTGKKYYVNTETGLSRWGLPDINLRELKVEKKVSGWEEVCSYKVSPGETYYANASQGISRWNPRPKVEHVENEPLPDGWEKRLTKCKNVYYINKKEHRSTWEIPKATSIPASVRIPRPEPIPIVRPESIPKPIPIVKPEPEPRPASARIPRVEHVEPPRTLKWTENSCYLDSALFAFFAGPKNFIQEMLTMTLIDKMDERIVLKDCIGDDLETNVAHRKKIQDELKKIYKSITRTGRRVDDCTDLREALANCPNIEEYHGGDYGDSGEFITYLTSLFPIQKNIIHVTTYLTNAIGIDLEQVLEDYPNTNKKERPEESSLVYVITHLDEELRTENGFKLSNFLEKGEKINNILGTGGEYNEGGKKYKRQITVRTLISSPYLIISLKRLLERDGQMITDIFDPDLYIEIPGQLFTLTGVVMHTGGCHYVAVAKYNEKWWYYDDNPGRQPLLIEFESFEHFVKSSDDRKLTNPLTHGTQFYYTPIELE